MNVNEFIKLFEDEFEDATPEELQPDVEFKDLDDWSSLSALSVIAIADQEFGVIIKADEIRGVDTFQDLYDLILSKK